jgi:amino acid transporter
VSCTLGAGIYILTTDVLANYAGPGIIISFIIAGIATFFAGLSFAELAARVPKSGSAYTYIYVTINEFVAFIMGWNLVLEYLIGSLFLN